MCTERYVGYVNESMLSLSQCPPTKCTDGVHNTAVGVGHASRQRTYSAVGLPLPRGERRLLALPRLSPICYLGNSWAGQFIVSSPIWG